MTVATVEPGIRETAREALLSVRDLVKHYPARGAQRRQGSVVHAVHLDMQPRAVGGDGGQLARGDGRGVRTTLDVRQPAHAPASTVFLRWLPLG